MEEDLHVLARRVQHLHDPGIVEEGEDGREVEPRGERVDGCHVGFLRPGDLQQAELRAGGSRRRSEEHTSELQSLMRISYAVFCLKKKNKHRRHTDDKKHIKITPTIV